MTLSVIIPNYNNSDFIAQCLDSVLAQTLPPDEIIVVDDCSTDNSAEIIRQYEAMHDCVKGIYLTENKGVSHARNLGARASTCEYITMLDGDDFYYNKMKLENEMNLIAQNGGNVVSYSKIVYCDINSEIIKYIDYPDRTYLQGNIFSRLLKGKNEKALMRDYCYAKEVFFKAGMYDESKNLYEDFDLLLRLSKQLNFVFTADYGTAYRQKETGLSKRSEDVLTSTKESIINENMMGLPSAKRMLIRIYRRCHRFLHGVVGNVRRVVRK